jgi:hypothetical protein
LRPCGCGPGERVHRTGPLTLQRCPPVTNIIRWRGVVSPFYIAKRGEKQSIVSTPCSSFPARLQSKTLPAPFCCCPTQHRTGRSPQLCCEGMRDSGICPAALLPPIRPRRCTVAGAPCLMLWCSRLWRGQPVCWHQIGQVDQFKSCHFEIGVAKIIGMHKLCWPALRKPDGMSVHHRIFQSAAGYIGVITQMAVECRRLSKFQPAAGVRSLQYSWIKS